MFSRPFFQDGWKSISVLEGIAVRSIQFTQQHILCFSQTFVLFVSFEGPPRKCEEHLAWPCAFMFHLTFSLPTELPVVGIFQG